MKFFLVATMISVLGPFAYCAQKTTPASPLDHAVPHFELTDATLLDGIAELSSSQTPNLHFGIEEVPSQGSSSSLDRSVIFSLRVENATVRAILDLLCKFDSRYMWNTNGSSINIFPRALVGDSSYLPNRQLDHVVLSSIPDPTAVFSVLHKLFFNEQLAYMQMGGDISYSEPWTITFENVSVRELMNRVTEHLGTNSAWIVYGSIGSRIFTFQKGAFHTHAELGRMKGGGPPLCHPPLAVFRRGAGPL